MTPEFIIFLAGLAVIGGGALFSKSLFTRQTDQLRKDKQDFQERLQAYEQKRAQKLQDDMAEAAKRAAKGEGADATTGVDENLLFAERMRLLRQHAKTAPTFYYGIEEVLGKLVHVVGAGYTGSAAMKAGDKITVGEMVLFNDPYISMTTRDPAIHRSGYALTPTKKERTKST